MRLVRRLAVPSTLVEGCGPLQGMWIEASMISRTSTREQKNGKEGEEGGSGERKQVRIRHRYNSDSENRSIAGISIAGLLELEGAPARPYRPNGETEAKP